VCVVLWECVVGQWLGVRRTVGMCFGAVARCASNCGNVLWSSG